MNSTQGVGSSTSGVTSGMSGGTGVSTTTGGTGTTPGGAFVEAARQPPLQVMAKTAGAILATPKLRVVTFNNDADAAQLETFATGLAGSSYWAAVMSYGVGALTI